MPQVPFPHVITMPKQAYGRLKIDGPYARIVSDRLAVGDELEFLCAIGKDLQQKKMKVSAIIKERPAKGDWSAWPVHPTYYKCEFDFSEPA